MKRSDDLFHIAGGIIFVLLGIGAAFAQDREVTLKMNLSDLQVLDAAINKAPLPREVTQPFVTKIQAQIVEQMKPKDEPKAAPTAAPVDPSGNPGTAAPSK